MAVRNVVTNYHRENNIFLLSLIVNPEKNQDMFFWVHI